MVAVFRAHPRQGLAVLVGSLTAPGVAYARLRHQIPFVRAVHEDLRLEHCPVLGGYAVNAAPHLPHAAGFFQQVILIDVHPRVARHLPEDLFRDVRLEVPGYVFVIALPGAFEELARHAADRLLPPEVCAREPARHHPADPFARRNNSRPLSLTGGGAGGDDRGGSAAVHHDSIPVRLLPAGGRKGHKQSSKRNDCWCGSHIQALSCRISKYTTPAASFAGSRGL